MSEVFRETRLMEIVLANQRKSLAHLLIWDSEGETNALERLDFKYEDLHITKWADTHFEALQFIRLELEPHDILLVCYGASLNVYPSPMAFNMGGAEKAYKLELGKDAELRNLVSIFDTGNDVMPATVAEQNAFYESWGYSVGRNRE